MDPVQASENATQAIFLETTVPLNIRTTPIFRGEKNIIHTLQPGTILSVLGKTEKGHLHVRSAQGIEGYIFNNQRYFKNFNPKESLTERQSQAQPVLSTSGRISPRTDSGLLLPLCGCTHVRCRKTSGFGMRRHPILRSRRMHLGIDIGGPIGQPVRAAADGIVGKGTKRSRSGWGNRVVLVHQGELKDNKGKLVTSKGYETQYNHLHKILVKAGQRVKRGDIIGTVGSTGRSTGPHLDFNVRANGKYQDPMKFFEEGSVKYSKAFKNTTAACPVESTVPGSSDKTTTSTVQ